MKTHKNQSKFARAKTPEMIRKQKAAIINYYIQKRKRKK